MLATVVTVYHQWSPSTSSSCQECVVTTSLRHAERPRPADEHGTSNRFSLHRIAAHHIEFMERCTNQQRYAQTTRQILKCRITCLPRM